MLLVSLCVMIGGCSDPESQTRAVGTDLKIQQLEKRMDTMEKELELLEKRIQEEHSPKIVPLN